jgi:hypothetical protein
MRGGDSIFEHCEIRHFRIRRLSGVDFKIRLRLFKFNRMMNIMCSNCTAFLSRRPPHAFARSRSQLKRMTVLICIPVVLCNLPKVLGSFEGGNIQSKSQLRRSVSLPSCMNHHVKNLESIKCNRHIPIYSPVHSPPTELDQEKKPSREFKPQNFNIDISILHRAAQERREGLNYPTEVYTKIQTQLYPQMHF